MHTHGEIYLEQWSWSNKWHGMFETWNCRASCKMATGGNSEMWLHVWDVRD